MWTGRKVFHVQGRKILLWMDPRLWYSWCVEKLCPTRWIDRAAWPMQSCWGVLRTSSHARVNCVPLVKIGYLENFKFYFPQRCYLTFAFLVQWHIFTISTERIPQASPGCVSSFHVSDDTPYSQRVKEVEEKNNAKKKRDSELVQIKSDMFQQLYRQQKTEIRAIETKLREQRGIIKKYNENK